MPSDNEIGKKKRYWWVDEGDLELHKAFFKDHPEWKRRNADFYSEMIMRPMRRWAERTGWKPEGDK